MAQPLWFRMWSEAKNDAKLDALTDAEFRCWFKLLCAASENDPRGEVEVDDLELLALELRVDEADLQSAIERMKRLRLVVIDGDSAVFPSFENRQYNKPSDKPEAVKKRVARHRENDCNAPVTPCNADVTPDVTRLQKEKDIQIEKETDTTSVQSLGNLPDCLRSARVEMNGSENTYAGHFLRELESHAGPTWVMRKTNIGKLGDAIREGCGDCDGSHARRCASAFIKATRELAADNPDKQFPTGLLLYRLREGAR